MKFNGKTMTAFGEFTFSDGGSNVTHCFDGTIAGEYIDYGLTTLRLGAFAQCKDLTKISLPWCEKIAGRYAFYECENVTTIELPNLKTITDGNYTFYNMKNVQEFILPNLTSAAAFGAVFYNCYSAKKIDLRNLGGVAFDSNCFRYCNDLEILILGGDKINTLANTNVLGSAGSTAPNGLSIYVPDDLVDNYKAATNWTTYASKIKPRSELEE